MKSGVREAVHVKAEDLKMGCINESEDAGDAEILERNR